MTLNRRQVLQTAAAAGLVLTTPFAIAQPRRTTRLKQYTGRAFGTRWQLSLRGTDNPDDAISIIIDVVQSIDKSMSPWRADSEISIFNRLPANTDTKVSAVFNKVVRTGLQIATASSGAFDPTVGPAVNRLGFGPVTGSTECTFKDIELTSNTLRKRKSGTTLDLCGIAKGFALDEMTSGLSQAGYQHFLLELGGELVARGTPSAASDRQWKVGIDLPTGAVTTHYPCELNNRSIATSGLAHNSFSFNNQQYSHLVNPIDKRSSTSELFSVSVIHDSAMMADAWSTALFIMGRAKGQALARAHQLDALFISDDPDNMQFTGTGDFFQTGFNNIGKTTS